MALIAGPTASGKSALALQLAQIADGVIINADSSQIYSDLRIISARPSESEAALAPHRLFGHVDGATAYNVAAWVQDAKAAITETLAAGRLPIIVGGTGLYIRALVDGIAPLPDIDAAIRAEVRALPVAEAHRLLAFEDPAAAARLRPSDTTRVARALEVIRATGRPLADWQAATEGGIGGSVRLIPTILTPPRDWLYARCDARFNAMLDDGGIPEVAALLARELPPSLPVMRAIGVAEIAAMLAGEIDRDEAVARAAQATRRYAKRQYTWFAHQPPEDWIRIRTQLDDDISSNIAIKLREMALTA